MCVPDIIPAHFFYSIIAKSIENNWFDMMKPEFKISV